MMVNMVSFTRHVKDHTLLHVHHKIDCALERFRVHRCPVQYSRELLAIPEVSSVVILEYLDELKKQM